MPKKDFSTRIQKRWHVRTEKELARRKRELDEFNSLYNTCHKSIYILPTIFNKIKDLDPDFSKTVDEHFDELIADESDII